VPSIGSLPACMLSFSTASQPPADGRSGGLARVVGRVGSIIEAPSLGCSEPRDPRWPPQEHRRAEPELRQQI
jgi:hypothetical protein